MRALRVVSLSSVLVVASAGAQGTPSCSKEAGGLAAFDTSQVTRLVGTYDVELIDTTGFRGERVKHRGRLTLWLQETQPSRTGLPTRPLPAGQKLLAGAWDAQGADTGSYWQRLASRDHQTPGAVWSTGSLRLGEYGNSVGMSLYVTAIGDAEVRGKWNTGSGMGVTVDFTGARTPESAGYYCARRVP